MNDTARVAVSGYRRARGFALGHPSLSLGCAGFVAATVTMVAGGRIVPPRSVIPLTSWFGLLNYNSSSNVGPGIVMLVGVTALLMLWLVAIRIHHAGRVSERSVWAIFAAWATPLILGPPLLSNDVWTYAAQGLMLRHGIDPYQVGPSALGNIPAVAAVDPSWRSVPSPYGPLASTLQHLAVAISGGSPLGAAIVFRAVGVACLIGIGLLAADLAGPRRRVQALTITVLNPLLLLHVLSAAHLDGVMCVLVLGAVVAANQRRWAIGMVLAVAAGAVKAPAFAALPTLVAVHLQGRRGSARWAALGRDVVLAAACIAGVSEAVPNGWGWVHALNTPALGHTALAPASLVSDVLRPMVPGASFDDLSTGGRISALAAAACIVVYLTLTAHARALDRSVGYSILAVGILSPVVYPWYLLGGIVCLAPTARGARRDWIVLLSAVGCVLSPPGFSVGASTGVSIATIVISLLVIGPRVRQRRRDKHEQVVRPRVTAQ
jgi:alpha-1,6-mannosyltransferase